MKRFFLLLCFTAIFVVAVFSKHHATVQTPNGLLKYEEEWGYVTVRKNAHSFWWLMSVKNDSTRPLIVWLQGGPGGSSTGFGNFVLLGPKDVNLNDRNSTWLQVADLVFIDNPVGVGYSYVDSPDAYTKNVQEIGADLVAWAKSFFRRHKQYQNRDFYIFSESYGGKMAAEFGKQLQDAIDKNAIKAKLAGVVLGDSWISAMDFINTWPEYLYSFSFFDDYQMSIANDQADECQKLVNDEKWRDATICFGTMQNVIENLTSVDMYNVLDNIMGPKNAVDPFEKFRKREIRRHADSIDDFDPLSDLMNGKIRKMIKIIPKNVTWSQDKSHNVFDNQMGDFMKPNYATVDNLLNRGINVTVYNGQLDLICDTLGVEKWISRLQWEHLEEYQSSPKLRFGDTSSGSDYYYPVWGFQKSFKNFQMFYILRAGHMVAMDAPWPALEVVKKIIGKK